MDAILELFRSIKTCGQLAGFINIAIEDKTVNACGEYYVQILAFRKSYQVIIGHELLTIHLDTSNKKYSASFTERFPDHVNSNYTFGREECIHISGHGYEKLILNIDDKLKGVLSRRSAA